MKRKFTLSILPILFLWASTVMAQTKDVSGKVTDSENSLTLPGVVVKLKGTSIAVATNNNGEYAIKIPSAGGTLTFSYIGYTPKEVVVTSQSVISVSLSPAAEELSEVVVTALGIKRDPRSLAYSTQPVDG